MLPSMRAWVSGKMVGLSKATDKMEKRRLRDKKFSLGNVRWWLNTQKAILKRHWTTHLTITMSFP